MVENIVSGKKYRILVDAANDVWDRISFWTKASDVYYDDGTTVEVNKPNAMLKRNTFYSVGSVTYENSAPSWVMFKCTTAGTTAATVPSTYSTISSPGTTITDGTARFTAYDVRPSTTLSTSSYQIPAMSLVNNLNAGLMANGTKFYFDYQNGKYGYNTSSGRGSGTFHPFSNFSEFQGGLTIDGWGSDHTTSCKCYPGTYRIVFTFKTFGLYGGAFTIYVNGTQIEHWQAGNGESDDQASNRSWTITVNAEGTMTCVTTGSNGNTGMSFLYGAVYRE